jgi:hypothetical protein
MRYHAIFVFSFAALLSYRALAQPSYQQEITPAPAGPFHVNHAQLLDSSGQPFLMRGTQLTDFHPRTAAQDNRAGADFGPHSATSLTAVRLRFNMNTVRLPLDVREASEPGYFAALAEVVRRANQMELLVILAAGEPGAALPSARSIEFWSGCAAAFKDYPNVLFGAFSGPSPAALPSGVDPHSAAGGKSGAST